MQVVMEMRDYLALENCLHELTETLLNPNASKNAPVDKLRERNDLAWDIIKRALARLEVA